MALYTMTVVAAPGQTVYAYPDGNGDFDLWGVDRVALEDTNSVGLYSGEISTAGGRTVWAAYYGGDAPTSFSDAFYREDFTLQDAIALLATASALADAKTVIDATATNAATAASAATDAKTAAETMVDETTRVGGKILACANDDGDQVLSASGFGEWLAEANAILAKVNLMLVADGDSWKLTAAALAEAPTTESLGTGARTVVITVNDGTNVLESARVRVTKYGGADSFVGNTDSSGEITFSLDDGTWSVAITHTGYSFAPEWLVVNGNETQTYSMAALSLTPSEVGRVTGYLYVEDNEGTAKAGVDITLTAYLIPGTGLAVDDAARVETSAANGLVSFTNLIPGASYKVAGPNGVEKIVRIPSDATSPCALQSIVV